MHALMVGTRLSDLIVFHGKDGDLAANPGPTMAHVDVDFILFHPLHLSLWVTFTYDVCSRGIGLAEKQLIILKSCLSYTGGG